MEIDVTIEGLDELLKALEEFKGKPAARVLKSAIRGGLNIVGKQMKADVDPKVKAGAKAVKTKIKERRGVLTAKVGFGVGRKRLKAGTVTVAQRTKPGVGIGPRNIHWWVAGTHERITGYRTRRKQGVITKRIRKANKPVRSTGIMPAMQPKLAWIAYQKRKGQINAEMIKRGALQLKKEIAKTAKPEPKE